MGTSHRPVDFLPGGGLRAEGRTGPRCLWGLKEPWLSIPAVDWGVGTGAQAGVCGPPSQYLRTDCSMDLTILISGVKVSS